MGLVALVLSERVLLDPIRFVWVVVIVVVRANRNTETGESSVIRERCNRDIEKEKERERTTREQSRAEGVSEWNASLHQKSCPK